MRSEQSLTPKEYASYLRRNISLLPNIWGGSLSGFVIGRFFSVANRAEYEWNRRITCECSRAIGIIVPAGEGCQIRYIQLYGLFSPFWLVFLWIVCAAMLWTSGMGWPAVLAGLALSLSICGLSALVDSLTENGVRTADDLEYFLLNPDSYV